MISTAKAEPATMKPARNMTKNAGPSAESANEKSRPHRSQHGRKARNPRNRRPSPHCGQRPKSPATMGDGGVSDCSVTTHQSGKYYLRDGQSCADSQVLNSKPLLRGSRQRREVYQHGRNKLRD